MTLDTKSIAPKFAALIRSHAYFHKWKKKGARAFWNLEEPISKGAELVLFKGSFEKNQLVGLGLHLSIVTTVVPWLQGTSISWKNGRLQTTAFVLRNGQIGEPSLGEGVWSLGSQHDLDSMMRGLSGLLDSVAIPFLERSKSIQNYLNWCQSYFEVPTSLPITLAVQGQRAARNDLLDWLLHGPDSRPRKDLFDWAVENKLLTQTAAARLELASIQAKEQFLQQTRSIVEELRAAEERRRS